MSENGGDFTERLKKYPYLKSRIEAVLDIVESKGGIDRADEAEELLIEEMRHLGKEALKDWAVGKEKEKALELNEKEEGVYVHSKKNSGGTQLTVKSV